MDEDDALYDSNGKIIKGKEDLVKRLLDLYKMFDEYNAKENIGDKFTSVLEDNGVSEDVANEIKSQLSDDEIKKASELDILPYIDENATVESVREPRQIRYSQGIPYFPSQILGVMVYRR